MIEQDHDVTEDALLRIRKGIVIDDDYQKFKTALGYVSCDELTKEQLDKLQVLNLHLLEYEKEIKKQVQDMLNYAQNKADDKNDWLEELAWVDVEMGFYLAEDDPDYNDDAENLLVTMTQMFSSKKEIYGIDDDQNHNEFAHWDATRCINGIAHIMCGDYHCWTFHGLYDHTELQWEEILRIGIIDVDFDLKMGCSGKPIPTSKL